jgi:hypothetical protein
MSQEWGVYEPDRSRSSAGLPVLTLRWRVQASHSFGATFGVFVLDLADGQTGHSTIPTPAEVLVWEHPAVPVIAVFPHRRVPHSRKGQGQRGCRFVSKAALATLAEIR